MNAIRIDPSSAKLPPASPMLYEEMSKAAFREMSAITLPGVDTDWNALTEPIRDLYLTGAKAMYAVLAKRGGGKVTKLRGGVE